MGGGKRSFLFLTCWVGWSGSIGFMHIAVHVFLDQRIDPAFIAKPTDLPVDYWYMVFPFRHCKLILPAIP
jgi:hypothetical protein